MDPTLSLLMANLVSSKLKNRKSKTEGAQECGSIEWGFRIHDFFPDPTILTKLIMSTHESRLVF